MNPSNFMKIGNSLESHHAVFYQLWEMGAPVFTESIPTACITFDQEGRRISFLFNPKFYEKLSEYEKQFIICHECMHVILNHGSRISGMNQSDLPVANLALDIVINHLLVDRFGFKRDSLSMEKDLCWIDTVFTKPQEIKKEQCFEYYFKKLCQSDEFKTQMLVDSHDFFQNESVEDIIDHLNKTISKEDKNSIKGVIEKYFENDKNSKTAGTKSGGKWIFADVSNVKTKKKWETVIKKWSKKYTTEFRDVEQWARINRRFSAISTDMFLPSEMEEEDRSDPKKITVWFFQDTSGSCIHLKDRFFKAAMSLSTKKFDVKMHCFDTQVYETDLESKKLYGFGGTYFHIIEYHIQSNLKGKEYPTVFVATDGYGTFVSPEYPKKWYWFLTNNYRNNIPGECNIFNLSDYE